VALEIANKYGPGVIIDLDPGSKIPGNNIDRIIDKYRHLEFDCLNHNKHSPLNVVPNNWQSIQKLS